MSAVGVLDGSATAELRDAMMPLAAAGGAHVVADLADATFVDSGSVLDVERVAALLESTGGSLVVVTRDPRIRTQLVLGGSAARIENTLADAVAVPA